MAGLIVVPVQLASHLNPVPHVAAPATVMSEHNFMQYSPGIIWAQKLSDPRHR
jgi:hypothetical protein